MPAKSNLRLVAPSHLNRTVPGRAANATYRKREHLTPAEVDKLIEAAKGNRYGHRDATLVLVAFRHGSQGQRALRIGVVAGRLAGGHAACAPGQERQAGHSPGPGR
jgi:hypothetical protein